MHAALLCCRSLLHCLRFICFLELEGRRHKLQLPTGLGSGAKLVHLFAFLLNCGDLFLDPIAAAHLTCLLKALTEAGLEAEELEAAARPTYASFFDL